MDIWTQASDKLTAVVEEKLPTYGGMALMATSGAKGNIVIPDSWHCELSKFIVNGKDHNINQKYNNIFSYEIESISNSLLNKEPEPKYPAIKRDETEINMKILNDWKNSNEK